MYLYVIGDKLIPGRLNEETKEIKLSTGIFGNNASYVYIEPTIHHIVGRKYLVVNNSLDLAEIVRGKGIYFESTTVINDREVIELLLELLEE